MEILDNIKKFAQTDRIAAVDINSKLSYAELESRSEAIAAKLHRDFVRGTTVCLWGDKENDMLCFILACLKAGHPYVVLSSYFPPMRIRQIVELAKPCVILCAANNPPEIPQCEVLAVSDIETLVSAFSAFGVTSEVEMKREEILTYFFTSGSTGIPKCVPATLDAALNISEAYGSETEKFIIDDLKTADVKPIKCLNIASYAFCSSIDVIVNNLGRFGMTLYAVSHEQSSDYDFLYNYIKEINPHIFDCSPQFLSMCFTDPDFNEATLTNLRMLSVGGENLSSRIGNEFMNRFPHVPLCNGYGATEMCAGPMWCTVTRDMLNKYSVMPIGTPVAGSSCFMEDDDGNIIEQDGVTGELIVEGNCLAPGYLNDPERTEKAFRKKEDGTVQYHTNDLVVRYDGQYFYVGRKDNLVKVGGYRVEIEEVEEYIGRIDKVKSCAVVPVVKEGRTVMLAAYIVLCEKPASVIFEIKRIRHEMLERLQPYMVPQKIVFVDELPLNTNGKVDRALLKEKSAIR